jgi:ribosomal protein L40E
LLLLFTQPNGYLKVEYVYRENTRPAAEMAAAQHKICPKCAEAVKEAATICRFCNYEFMTNCNPVELSESAK